MDHRGRGCADARFPGVYSRISFFYDWIIEQVCELSPDDAPEYMGCERSSAPSPAPSVSSIPSVSPMPSPEPTLVLPNVIFSGWNVAPGVLLEHCEGDCDSDKDCIQGLICLQRSNGEDVPGCVFDGANAAVNRVNDVCVYP
jgi:hypothetical protein